MLVMRVSEEFVISEATEQQQRVQQQAARRSGQDYIRAAWTASAMPPSQQGSLAALEQAREKEGASYSEVFLEKAEQIQNPVLRGAVSLLGGMTIGTAEGFATFPAQILGIVHTLVTEPKQVMPKSVSQGLYVIGSVVGGLVALRFLPRLDAPELPPAVRQGERVQALEKTVLTVEKTDDLTVTYYKQADGMVYAHQVSRGAVKISDDPAVNHIIYTADDASKKLLVQTDGKTFYVVQQADQAGVYMSRVEAEVTPRYAYVDDKAVMVVDVDDINAAIREKGVVRAVDDAVMQRVDVAPKAEASVATKASDVVKDAAKQSDDALQTKVQAASSSTDNVVLVKQVQDLDTNIKMRAESVKVAEIDAKPFVPMFSAPRVEQPLVDGGINEAFISETQSVQERSWDSIVSMVDAADKTDLGIRLWGDYSPVSKDLDREIVVPSNNVVPEVLEDDRGKEIVVPEAPEDGKTTVQKQQDDTILVVNTKISEAERIISTPVITPIQISTTKMFLDRPKPSIRLTLPDRVINQGLKRYLGYKKELTYNIFWGLRGVDKMLDQANKQLRKLR